MSVVKSLAWIVGVGAFMGGAVLLDQYTHNRPIDYSEAGYVAAGFVVVAAGTMGLKYLLGGPVSNTDGPLGGDKR